MNLNHSAAPSADANNLRRFFCKVTRASFIPATSTPVRLQRHRQGPLGKSAFYFHSPWLHYSWCDSRAVARGRFLGICCVVQLFQRRGKRLLKWSALGAVSELVAALASLASFVFIRQQMADNHEVTKAAHQREVLNALEIFLPRREVIKSFLMRSPLVLRISKLRMPSAGMCSLPE